MQDEIKEKMYNPFLIGKKVYLRGLEEKDLEGNWYKWFNDPEVTKFMHKGAFPNTIEKQRVHFEKMSLSNTDLLLAIIDKKTNTHIGVVGLHNINWVTRIAEIAIVIGEKEFWGLDYGLEAMALLIQHGFCKINLYKISAGQHVGLEKWRNALGLIGFKTEAVLKKEMFSEGKYWNKVLISVFGEDFFKLLEERKGKILGESIRDLLRQQKGETQRAL